VWRFGNLPPKEEPGHFYTALTAQKTLEVASRRLAPSH
jgi:hypothetical protein